MNATQIETRPQSARTGTPGTSRTATDHPGAPALEAAFRLREHACSHPRDPREQRITHKFTLSPEASAGIEQRSRGLNAVEFGIVAGGVLHVLAVYSGSAAVSIQTPRLAGAGASSATSSNSCDNLLCDNLSSDNLSMNLDWDASVAAHLDNVRRMILERDHAAGAQPENGPGRQPPASNVLLCEEGVDRAGSDAFPCELEIRVGSGPGCRVRITATAAAFSRAYLEQFARHLNAVLSGYRSEDRRLGDVELIDDAERAGLLAGQAGESRQATQPTASPATTPTATPAATPAASPPAALPTIPEAFERQAARTPERMAVIDGDSGTTADGQTALESGLSYRQLNARANRLAHYLRSEYGLQQGDVVGVVSDASPLWITAMLAVMKAGCVYLPVDAGYPEPRLRFLLEDSGARVLMMHSGHLAALSPFYETPMFALDLQLDGLETPDTNLDPGQPNDAAYIIYTSGSTGTPKAVVLEHAGFVNMALHHAAEFGIGEADRFSQFYGASFDSSLFEVFVPLLSGAAVVTAPRFVVKDPLQFASHLARHRVTTLTAPPLYLDALDLDRLPSLRRIVSAGDHAKSGHAQSLAQRIDYYNSYGPTEASVCVTHYRVPPAAQSSDGLTPPPPARVPVGKCIPGAAIYLLTEDGRLTPRGCVGEICIAGVGLARGYRNRPELTAAAFLDHPLKPGERLYRTGDLGVWGNDGNLELIGRKDTQVKIRGYRVELGEIEAALTQHEAVREAVVLLEESAGGAKKLVAYLTVNQPVAAERVRSYLAARLPEFMLPASIVFIGRMPLTANGKIDRNALRAPEPVAWGSSGDSEPGSPNRSAAEPRSESRAEPRTESRAEPRTEPCTEMESKIAAIWTSVLGAETGLHDDFFEAGGDSILIIQAVSRAAQAGIRITAQQFFEHPTIAGLAAVAADLTGNDMGENDVAGNDVAANDVFANDVVPIDVVANDVAASPEHASLAGETNRGDGSVTGRAPLTPILEWFVAQHLAEPDHFNQSVMLQIPADLGPETVGAAVEAVWKHHDALRMRLAHTGQRWELHFGEEPNEAPFTWSAGGGEPDIARTCGELQRRMSLNGGALLRVHLFQPDAAGSGSAHAGKDPAAKLSAKLFIAAHHAAVDGVSWRILIEDLQLACNQLAAGQPVRLPAKTTSYLEWAARLRQYAEGMPAPAEGWNELAATGTARLPVDPAARQERLQIDPAETRHNVMEPEQNLVGDAAEVTCALDAPTTAKLLRQAPATLKARIDELLLTALARTLSAFTGQLRVPVDLEGHGRAGLPNLPPRDAVGDVTRNTDLSELDLSRTVGWFTSLYPVALEAAAGESPALTLARVKGTLRTIPAQGAGYGIAHYLQPETFPKLASHPAPEVLFNYLGQTDQVLAADTGWAQANAPEAADESPANRRAHVLEINSSVSGGMLQVRWTYATKLHLRATIERLAQRYLDELTTLAAHTAEVSTAPDDPAVDDSALQKDLQASDFPAAGLDQESLNRLIAGMSR